MPVAYGVEFQGRIVDTTVCRHMSKIVSCTLEGSRVVPLTKETAASGYAEDLNNVLADLVSVIESGAVEPSRVQASVRNAKALLSVVEAVKKEEGTQAAG